MLVEVSLAHWVYKSLSLSLFSSCFRSSSLRIREIPGHFQTCSVHCRVVSSKVSYGGLISIHG